MNKIKKHITQNSDVILATVQVAGALVLVTTVVILRSKLIDAYETVGAASFVIQDFGGDPVKLIAEKLIEHSGK